MIKNLLQALSPSVVAMALLLAGCDSVPLDSAFDDPLESHDTPAEQGRDDDDHEPVQAEEEAREQDDTLVAKALGLPPGEVKDAIDFQDEFGEFQSWVLLRFPSAVGGTWVDPVPAHRGHIRFIGDVPAEVAEELGRRPTLEPNVNLLGGARLSTLEHQEHANEAVRILIAAGHPGVAAGFDPRLDTLQIRLQGGGPAAALEELREGWALGEFSEDAVTLTTVDDPAPLLRLESSRGGAWMRDDGTRECTSGWTVEGPDGDGLITAGHCNGLNQYEPPGGTVYSTAWRDQVLGASGDVEYHTTSRVEVPRFYASAGNQRYVTSTRSENTMVGRTVCVYGRSSNLRTCNHVITLINETVGVQQPNGSIRVTGGLAEATNTSTQTGDSGGGWSYGNQAYGTHVGQGGGFSYFFPVEEAEVALGVTVLTN